MMTLEEMLLLKLQEEVKLQCECALLAYEHLNQTVRSDLLKQAEQNWHDAIENHSCIAHYRP